MIKKGIILICNIIHSIANIINKGKFHFGLHRSAIKGLTSNSITQLAPLAKTFFGPQLVKALKKGIPLPLKVGF